MAGAERATHGHRPKPHRTATLSLGVGLSRACASLRSLRDGPAGGTPTPVLIKEAKILLIDDGPGKPVGINTFIGRHPIMAFGNSDGDLQMLQYTTLAGGARFGAIVHHTDAEREYAYDRKSPVGKLDKALDEAAERKWTVVDMKKDWKVIFPKD